MRKSVAPVGVVVAGLLLLVGSLVYMTASPALAGSGTGGTESLQASAPGTGGVGQLRRGPRTHTPTRTPTRTPTPFPTLTPTPTSTPIPSCGLAWRFVPRPPVGTALYGLGVVSANDIWAVGIDYAMNPAKMLIEHWDGTAWSIVPAPNVGPDVAYLFKVSAVSANDVWAVGTRNNRTLAIHWNGVAWSIAPTPNPGIGENYVLDVEAVSTNDVWAMGYFRNGPPYAAQMLALHWDGTVWSLVPISNPAFFSNTLTSVDAISANDIWAVGYSSAQFAPASQTRTLTMHWDGSTWSVVASGSAFFNQLTSVSAISSNDVWAVGTGTNALYIISMHWNGSTWSEVFVPNIANNEIHLNEVAAISSNDVWAVGWYFALEVGHDVPLMMHWDGTAWSEVESPSPATSQTIYLQTVAAVSGTDVWTVGYNYTDGLLILHYSDPCASKAGSSR